MLCPLTDSPEIQRLVKKVRYQEKLSQPWKTHEGSTRSVTKKQLNFGPSFEEVVAGEEEISPGDFNMLMDKFK